LFAYSTHLGANPAMLMMIRVALTLIPATPTSFDASLKSDAGDFRHELGLPAEDATGRDADVTAVVAQSNARNERLDIGLAKIGVSAGRAALSTVEARVDAGDQRAERDPKCARMRLQNLLSVGHHPSSLSCSNSVEGSQSDIRSILD
jgi:hypothetical protein